MPDTTISQMLERALGGTTSLATWNEFVLESPEAIDLSGIDLTGVNLTGLVFSKCRMVGANLSNCRMVGVNLSHAILTDAVFDGSNLTDATFQRAAAQRAKLRNCQVQGTDFAWCDLTEADLTGVDLSVAKLWKTDLRGATYRFAARTEQCFISDPDRKVELSIPIVPIQRMLKVVGAMLGIPYRWEGDGKMPNVEMPDRIDDPRAFLETTLGKLGLVARARAGADGSLIYIVSAIDRHGDLPHLRKRYR